MDTVATKPPIHHRWVVTYSWLVKHRIRKWYLSLTTMQSWIAGLYKARRRRRRNDKTDDRCLSVKSSGQQQLTFRETWATSWPVTVVWVLLSVAVASANLVSLAQPTWFVKQDQEAKNHQLPIVLIGALSFCYRVRHVKLVQCHVYGNLLELRRYPSAWWHAASVLYCGGCVLLSCCAVAAILGIAFPTPVWRRQAAFVVGTVQALAVLVLLMALLLFPLGLDSPLLRHHCGISANVYSTGDCQIGWAYTLAIMAAMAAVYCPLLVIFTSYKVYHPVHTSSNRWL